MKIAILVMLIFLSGCGCLNPYNKTSVQLDQAYQNGQLTYAEYVQAKQTNAANGMQYQRNLMTSLDNIQPKPTTSTRTHCYTIGNDLYCDTN